MSAIVFPELPSPAVTSPELPSSAAIFPETSFSSISEQSIRTFFHSEHSKNSEISIPFSKSALSFKAAKYS